MRISRVLLFVLLPMFVSCTHTLSVSTRECVSPDGSWWVTDPAVDFYHEHKVDSRILWGENYKVIKAGHLLGQEDILCDEVKSLQVRFEKQWDDVLYDLIPFLTRTTIITYGKFKRKRRVIDIKDDIKIPRDGEDGL